MRNRLENGAEVRWQKALCIWPKRVNLILDKMGCWGEPLRFSPEGSRDPTWSVRFCLEVILGGPVVVTVSDHTRHHSCTFFFVPDPMLSDFLTTLRVGIISSHFTFEAKDVPVTCL